MTKAEFLEQIKAKIAHLPYEDLRKNLDFYSEMIEDRMEEGLTEEEAVATMEPPEVIAAKILEESEPAAPEEAPQEQAPGRPSRRRLFFLPLGILLIVTVVLAHFVTICIAGCTLGFGATCVWAALKEGIYPALTMGGAMLICTGLFLFLLPACGALRRSVSRVMGWITGKNNKEVTEG